MTEKGAEEQVLAMDRLPYISGEQRISDYEKVSQAPM